MVYIWLYGLQNIQLHLRGSQCVTSVVTPVFCSKPTAVKTEGWLMSSDASELSEFRGSHACCRPSNSFTESESDLFRLR